MFLTKSDAEDVILQVVFVAAFTDALDLCAASGVTNHVAGQGFPFGFRELPRGSCLSGTLVPRLS